MQWAEVLADEESGKYKVGLNLENSRWSIGMLMEREEAESMVEELLGFNEEERKSFVKYQLGQWGKA